jgi:hypothetical protein
MSTSKPIDLSTLEFTTPTIYEDEDLEEEDSYDDEFAFMKVFFQFFQTAPTYLFTTGVQVHDSGPKSSFTSC